MLTVKSHIDPEGISEFETREDAIIELHMQAEDLADLMGANVFHDDIGLSTVYDDHPEHYVCFWISER